MKQLKIVLLLLAIKVNFSAQTTNCLNASNPIISGSKATSASPPDPICDYTSYIAGDAALTQYIPDANSPTLYFN